MLCSSCGAPLGAVAHIYDDRLLCENCFLKIGSPSDANSPAHTVLFGQLDDQEREKAWRAIPPESQPLLPPDPESSASPTSFQAPPHPTLLIPGEQVIWQRTFKKGIIHRHATLTEVVTNLRALAIDDQLKSIVRGTPLKGAQVVVMDTTRVSTGVKSGYGRRGSYIGTSSGTSLTFGNVEFLLQGSLSFILYHVKDPFGLKRLIDGSVKSSKK